MELLLPDLLKPDLAVIFVGFNPSLRSARLGHHFAGRSNRFWKILYLAGLTDRLLAYQEDGRLLDYGYGLTNIVSRPTQRADEITSEEYREGRRILREKIGLYQPRIVCYVGAGVYKAFTAKEKKVWGYQETSVIPGSRDFVAPNTSGLVRLALEEQVKIYRQLRNSIY